MDIFTTFVEKNMLEQIRILEQVVMDNDVQAVDSLLALYKSHECDQAVDEVIYYTLHQLMKGSDVAVTRGLNHSSVDIQLLAMRCGCESNSVHFQTYLVEKIQQASDPLILAEIIRSMNNFADPELITVLLPYMHHEDSGVVGNCMDFLATLGGEKARDGLIELIQREMDGFNVMGGCSFVASLGMGCLSRFNDSQTIEFLVANIHNNSPTFRRLVGEALVQIGIDCIPVLMECILSRGIDEKIMAINCIGFIRHRKGAELLIAELDSEFAWDINVRFAMFEAIGRVDCLRSALCLADAIYLEDDDFILNAVLLGLERICHPGLAKVFIDRVGDKKWGQLIVHKLLALRLKKILTVIYALSGYRQLLIDKVAEGGDARIQQFCVSLFAESEHLFPENNSCLNMTKSASLPFADRLIVVADDSKAIIKFYCDIAQEVGFDILVAYDGNQALGYFQNDGSRTIDLLLTDMNMPNMDGLELVEAVRAMSCYSNLPILMATTESEASQRDVALHAGVSLFISKPFSRDVLVGRLQEMLQVG